MIDVQGRLFHWTADSRRLAVEVPADPQSMTQQGEDGTPVRWAPVTDRQAICRSDDSTGSVLGIFGLGYTRHQYREWLLTTVADLLDDDLVISSAGLLRGGAIAWVEVSMPDTITTPEGVAFRPNLLATTSFDGSIATTYKRTVTDTVCDNTRACALAEQGQSSRSSTAATPTHSSPPPGRHWRWCTPLGMSSPPRSPSCAPPPSPRRSGSASWTPRCLGWMRRGRP